MVRAHVLGAEFVVQRASQLRSHGSCHERVRLRARPRRSPLREHTHGELERRLHTRRFQLFVQQRRDARRARDRALPSHAQHDRGHGSARSRGHLSQDLRGLSQNPTRLPRSAHYHSQDVHLRSAR